MGTRLWVCKNMAERGREGCKAFAKLYGEAGRQGERGGDEVRGFGTGREREGGRERED